MNISAPVPVEKITRELVWTIETPCDTKNFNWALGLIHGDMRSRNIDLSYDDAYEVTSDESGIHFTVVVRES